MGNTESATPSADLTIDSANHLTAGAVDTKKEEMDTSIDTTQGPVQLAILHDGHFLALNSQVYLLQWTPQSTGATELHKQLYNTSRERLFKPAGVLEPVLPIGNIQYVKCITGFVEIWRADKMNRLEVAMGVQRLLSELPNNTQGLFFNPKIADLLQVTWIQLEVKKLPDIVTFNSTLKPFSLVQASAHSTARIAAGAVGAGLVGFLGYHKLGGKEFISDKVQNAENTAYGAARGLVKARQELVNILAKAPNTDLDVLFEDVESAFEDIGDILKIDSDSQFDEVAAVASASVEKRLPNRARADAR